MAQENSTPQSEDPDEINAEAKAPNGPTEEVNISIPSHASLPPPPEVHYTRPNLGKPRNNSVGREDSQTRNVTDDSQGDKRPDLYGRQQGNLFVVKPVLGLTAGLTFAASVMVGIWLGDLIDKHFHTSPWGLIVMLIIGVIAGFIKLVRLLDVPGSGRK